MNPKTPTAGIWASFSLFQEYIGFVVNTVVAAVLVIWYIKTEDQVTEGFILFIGVLVIATNISGWYLAASPFIGFLTLICLLLVVVSIWLVLSLVSALDRF